MTRPRRLTALVAVAAAATSLAACGNQSKEGAGRVVRAETEGIYLNLNHLKYQVQISRQLNPADPEDQAYLRGIAPAERTLKDDEVWFGVFMRVQNTAGEGSHMPAAKLEIEDTQDKVFEPIALDDTNIFAYRSEDPVPPKGLIPEADSPAAETTIQGALVLFKLTNESLDNRPLELKIEGREVPQQTGIVDLDV